MKTTRQDAIAAKEKWYKTGKSCLYGHFSKRLTKDGSCYECRMAYQISERKRLREILKDA